LTVGNFLFVGQNAQPKYASEKRHKGMNLLYHIAAYSMFFGFFSMKMVFGALRCWCAPASLLVFGALLRRCWCAPYGRCWSLVLPQRHTTETYTP